MHFLFNLLQTVFFWQEHHDRSGQDYVDDDDRQTDQKTYDIHEAARNDKIQDHRRNGHPDVIFDHHRGFCGLGWTGDNIDQVFVQPVEIDDADETTDENTQGKLERHDNEAEQDKYPQENPIGHLNFLLEGVFFYAAHFLYSWWKVFHP